MSKGYKTSHSQNSMYIRCPKAWHWNYVEKLVSPEQGASLFFGSAVDNAVMKMLEGKDYLTGYEKDMVRQFNFGKDKVIFDNPDIGYSPKDFDPFILEQADYDQMLPWAVQAGFCSAGDAIDNEQLIEFYKTCAKAKKNPYKKIKAAHLLYFNRCSWVSLRRKGLVLLEAFKTQFLPKVTKVLATQKRADIKDEATGDSIMGFIDMVLEIEGYDKPIIFDLKTAANPYTQDKIDLTTQLTLYAGMKGGEYNTNLVGYVVLCKNIQYDTVSTCVKCGNIRDGRHKTCNATDSNGNRCEGEWDTKVKAKPEVQVLVQEKSQEEIESLFSDIGNILLAMKNGVVYKNTEACANWFGSKCPYYNACHNNDTTGLVKK